MAKKIIKKTSGGNAVIYARYSSHNQREASIEQQIEWCRDLADRHGLTVVEIYSDKAISGKTDNRPSFQRMMRDAACGRFQNVIAWKSNRMGRNMLEAMLNDATLKEEGVKTLYVEEDFEDNAAGRFALRNMMNVNQFYSEAMAEDVKRGMLDNAKKCKVNGRMTFGYRKGSDGRYEIEPEQAEIVREIYNRVVEGWPYLEIMEDLNARGIGNRDGKPWQRTAFQTLLQNEQYIGVYKFDTVRIENGIPPILDRKVFERVQQILNTKGNPRGRRRSNADYILSGKLFCGHCGTQMIGICGTSKTGDKHYYYACQGKPKKICSKKNERKDKLERAVIDAVKRIIMDEKAINWLIEGYQEFMKTLRGQSTITAMEKELAETEKAIANLMRAIEMGIITDTTKDRMIELEDQKKDLNTRIRIETSLLKEMDPNQLRFTIEKFRDKNIEDRAYQKELINTFVKAVYVYDDRLKIVLNRGAGDDIVIPLDDINAVDEEAAGGPDVRVNDTKGHQNNSSAIRRSYYFANFCLKKLLQEAFSHGAQLRSHLHRHGTGGLDHPRL